MAFRNRTTWAEGILSNALACAMSGGPASDGHAMRDNIGHFKLVYFRSPLEIAAEICIAGDSGGAGVPEAVAGNP